MNRIFDRFPRLYHPQFLFGMFLIVVLVATIHRLWLNEGAFNNYLIFRCSFYHLVNGENLYSYHPGEHEDLYKYSPSFALLMAPMAILPKWLGLIIWNWMNVIVPFVAVSQLKLNQRQKAFILLFIVIELLGSIQNSQSNGLMTGLIIAAFASFENKKPVMAALLICLGFYVKLFAAVAGILFLFYDRKIRFLLAGACWLVLLGLLPAIFGGFDQLVVHYHNWLDLLKNDPAHDLNFSIMTLTQRWFNFTAPDSYYLIPGMIFLLLPLLRFKEWKNFHWRLTYLGASLIWVVIFNHKAESPTFVIAMAGVAIATVLMPANKFITALLWFVFVLTGLSATDLFPPYVRNEIIIPWCLKALPCIVAWCWIVVFLLREKFTENQITSGSPVGS
jgi:hypothetical protein